MFSCEEDKLAYEDYTYVAFTDPAVSDVSVSEDSGVYTFNIGVARVQSEDITVTLGSTDDTAIAGTHFTLPTSVVIPAGEQFGSFDMAVVDDSEGNTTRRFSIVIESVSNGTTVGFADLGSYQKNVSIVNDDCPTGFGMWFGDLSVEDVGYGSTPGTGSPNANGDCDVLSVVNNLPGIASPTNSTYLIYFTPASAGATNGTVVVNETVSRDNLTSGGADVDAVYSANGVYDEVAGTITLNYTLAARADADGAILGNYWTGTNVIPIP